MKLILAIAFLTTVPLLLAVPLHIAEPQVGPTPSDLAWKIGEWGPCKNGKHWRPVRCYHKKNGQEFQVAIRYCKQQLPDEEPIQEKSCEPNRPPQAPKGSEFFWKTDEWEPCKNGKHWRPVRCYHKKNGQEFQVAIRYCKQQLPDEKPIQEKSCENRQPQAPKGSEFYWKTDEWEPCKNGKQWRPVRCYHEQNGQEYQVAILYCKQEVPEEEPIQHRNCEKPQPHKPKQSEFYWKADAWKPCENGKQWRPVKCYNKRDGKEYHVDISYCEKLLSQEKLKQEKQC